MKIENDSSFVNNEKTYTEDETSEALDALMGARQAAGYTWQETLAFTMVNLALPLGVAHCKIIPAEKRGEVIARAKWLLHEHLINVALAQAYEVGSAVVWGGPYPHIHASNAFQMRDLLDLRLGIEGARDLVARVQAQLKNTAPIPPPDPFETFMSRRRLARWNAAKRK
jgi:hypothetical protein